MEERRLGLATGLFAFLTMLVGVAIVASSWTKLTVTFDEPNHLASGLEWIEDRSYTLWTENPPLARVVTAAIPYLAGARLPEKTSEDPAVGPRSAWTLGQQVLQRADKHRENLAQARAGTLFFYLLTVLLTGVLAGRRGRLVEGGLAAAAVATLPPVLAHSGVAATDIAFVAMFLLAVLCFVRWLERPGTARGVLVGASLGLLVLTKFTAILFFPPTVVIFALGYLRARGGAAPGASRETTRAEARRRLRDLGLAALALLLVVWAGYGFSFGPVADPRFVMRTGLYVVLHPPAERTGIEALLGGLTLPAPEFFHGLLHLRGHNVYGHPTYLFGQLGQTGFVAFYPVALFLKAPLSFWLLVLPGCGVLLARVRDRRAALDLAALATALVIVAVLAPSRMNLGVRHALVVYPLLAIAGANGLGRLRTMLPGGRRRLIEAAALVLLLWQLGIAVRVRPDQLTYFNPFAGAEPGKILLDSDLDWGQGLARLAEELRRRGDVHHLKVALRLSMAYACKEGLPPMEALMPHQPATGWIAIAENLYWGRTENWTLRDPCQPFSRWGSGAKFAPGWFRWLHAYQPVWRGGGMRLYYIPEPASHPGSR